MFDRFSDHSKKIMSLARQAAFELRHESIAPEHMLIGLLSLGGGAAAAVLARLGLDPAALAARVRDLVPVGRQPVTTGQIPFTPAAKRVLEASMEEAVTLRHNWIGSEHVLLGLLREGRSTASSVLTESGADLERVRGAIVEVLTGAWRPTQRRTTLRLLLVSNSTMHGGGYLEHCAGEIRDFLGERKRVLFVPYALADHDAYAVKARQVFVGLGHDLTSAHEHALPTEALEASDAVFVGGGNTFRLLKALYATGLLERIARRAAAGMPYIGSSAGTNVATPSIRTTNDMPIVMPPSFAALDLVPFQINPHYLDPDPASRHMGETREERLRQFHEEDATPVLGLREGCMLRVEGERMELKGTTAARLFRRGEPGREFTPPCDLSFLLAPQGG